MKVSPLSLALALPLTVTFMGDTQAFCFLSKAKGYFSMSATPPLDMAPDSFDDQYKSCVDELDTKLADPIRTDFANKKEYIEAWEKAASQLSSLSVPPGLKREYLIATLAYTLNTSSLYRDFNEAVRQGGQSRDHYLQCFSFKSFHFLLTRALQELRGSSSRCYQVYRGLRNMRLTISDQNKPVRLGQFASSSLNRKVASDFGHDTFLEITTCLGVDIKEFSFNKDQAEVLIPPYESFKVVDYRPESSSTTFIRLTSRGTQSNYECEYLQAAGLSRFSSESHQAFFFWALLLVAGAFGSPSFP